MSALRRYRNRLTQLLGEIQPIRAQPFQSGAACLSLQEKLISHIISIEGKIREKRKVAKEIRRALSIRTTVPLTKAQSRALKKRFASSQAAIEEYTRILLILRAIGDGIAFSYLDKFDIKPMAFKEASGFISGKEGSRLELEYLKLCFSEGKIAILNDLTNCMRYGDITTVTEDGYFTIVEVKSGERVSKRGGRQLVNLQKLKKYFNEDVIDEFNGIIGPIERKALITDEIHHRDALNALISSALESGKSTYRQVEEGMFYLVEVYGEFSLPEVLKQFKNPPIVSLLNDVKYNNVGYYPFTLSLTSPDHIFRFYAGEFVILIIVDSDVVSNFFKSSNLACRLLEDEGWAMEISEADEADITYKSRVGRHFCGRLFVEFLSLNWFLNEVAVRVRSEDRSVQTK
jgi:hypothetical protein